MFSSRSPICFSLDCDLSSGLSCSSPVGGALLDISGLGYFSISSLVCLFADRLFHPSTDNFVVNGILLSLEVFLLLFLVIVIFVFFIFFSCSVPTRQSSPSGFRFSRDNSRYPKKILSSFQPLRSARLSHRLIPLASWLELCSSSLSA